VIVNLGYGQIKEIDSLKKELLKPTLSDTTRIGLYYELGGKYYYRNMDSLKFYSKLALELSELSDNYLQGKIYNSIGMYYVSQSQMDSARYYLNQAINIGVKKSDTTLLVRAYANYGVTLRENTDFEESVQLSLKVIDLVEKDKYILAESQYNLAVDYANATYDSLAIKYFKLAVKSAEESNHEVVISYALSNLLIYSLDKDEMDLTKSYLKKSSELCTKTESPAICLNYYLRLGLYLDELQEFDKAETAYKKALNSAEELNDIYNIMFTYISLGEHFVTTKNPKKAINYLKKFERLYIENPTPDLGIRAYKNFAEAERISGNYKSSNEYLDKYIKINDSLNSENNKTAIANAETKYQSEKKDKEIAEQKLALTESKSKTRTMSILIVSLLLASILLWFLFQQRQRRIQQQLVTIQREQEVRTLESLMEGEEKERFRIAKELHDGVNGDLSAIKFKLSSLLEMNNTVIKEAVTMIDNSCEQVRAISHNLVPPSLKDFNLIEAVEDYCQNINSIHEPEVHFQHVGDAIDLDKKQEANLFRIVQELVTNSIKHAEAKEINVQLSYLENTLQLTVEDNGKGFNPNTVKSDGIGMQNVQSRVDYLNATIDFVSNEKGTSYTIAIDTKNNAT
jgi:signal transduction histidine kinase